MRKKYISMMLVAVLAAGTLAGCGDSSSSNGDGGTSTQKDSSGNSAGGVLKKAR